MNYINNMNTNYIDAQDLVMNNENGIYSGGFSVNSILMKSGISPIVTLNKEQDPSQYGGNKVSDIFNDLVVPNWAFYQNSKMIGGARYKNKNIDSDSESDSDSDVESDMEDDTIPDNLHEKLLGIVTYQESVKQKNKKPTTKKDRKVTSKKNITKKILKSASSSSSTPKK